MSGAALGGRCNIHASRTQYAPSTRQDSDPTQDDRGRRWRYKGVHAGRARTNFLALSGACTGPCAFVCIGAPANAGGSCPVPGCRPARAAACYWWSVARRP
jgi:hypothetical protein